MLNVGKVYFNFLPFVTKTRVEISRIIPQIGYKYLYIS